jgi:hypothetical protein
LTDGRTRANERTALKNYGEDIKMRIFHPVPSRCFTLLLTKIFHKQTILLMLIFMVFIFINKWSLHLIYNNAASLPVSMTVKPIGIGIVENSDLKILPIITLPANDSLTFLTLPPPATPIAATSTGTRSLLFTTPGSFYNNSFFIWGARITTTFDNPDEMFLDFWIQGIFHVKKKWVKFTPNHVVNVMEDAALLKLRFPFVVIQENKEKNVLSRTCQFFPNQNIDDHAKFAHSRFRCDLSDYSLYLRSVEVVKVKIKDEHTLEDVVEFAIPRSSDSVGNGGPENSTPIPFYQWKPYNLTLCSGGISTLGVKHVAEWIQHHIRVGVDHFVLGLHGSRYDWAVYEDLKILLQPLIEAGVVSIHRMHVPWNIIGHIDRDSLKMMFYEACLYHSKGVSEYVAICKCLVNDAIYVF